MANESTILLGARRAFIHRLEDLENMIKGQVQQVGVYAFLKDLKHALSFASLGRTGYRESSHSIVYSILRWYYRTGLTPWKRKLSPFRSTEAGCFVYLRDLDFTHDDSSNQACLTFIDKLYNMCRSDAGYNWLSLKDFLLENGLKKEVEEWWPQGRQTRNQATQVAIVVLGKRKGDEKDHDPAVKRLRAGAQDQPTKSGTSQDQTNEFSSALVVSLQERVQKLSDREKQLTRLSAGYVEEREEVKKELASMQAEHESCDVKLKELENKNSALENEVTALKEQNRKDQQRLMEQQKLTEQFETLLERSQDVTKSAKYRALKKENKLLRNAKSHLREALLEVETAMGGISTTLNDRIQEAGNPTYFDDSESDLELPVLESWHGE